MSFTNLNVAQGWDYDGGTALSVDTNVPAFLQLPVIEDDFTNIVLTNGSLGVWVQANWTSVADGGTGPGAWAVLWDIGSYSYSGLPGAWLLAVDPPGSNLVWVTQSGGTNQVLWTPIDFDAGDWHQVMATWSETNSSLYIDGQLATNSGPILYGPDEGICATNGFCVGSMSATGTNAGTDQFHGQLQWLESFSYPLSADDVAAEFSNIAGYLTYYGFSVPGSGGGFRADDGGPPGIPDGGGTNSGGGTNYGNPDGGYIPVTYTITSNYSQYTNFWLVITNNATNAYVTVMSTLSNLTYVILTNDNLANAGGWGVCQVLLANNSVTPAPPIALGTNTLYFDGVLIAETGTNGLPDWWQMEYFGTLNVNPFADPDGDGLCNLDEYQLRTNPTNANSISANFNDAQALYLAYVTFDTNCRYALFRTNLDTNTVLVTMSNTLVGSNYQIYSHIRSDTNNTWIVETNFIGTNTITSVPVYLNGRNLQLIGGSGADSDGDGLPDGYEVLATQTDPLLPDTGLTGTPDGYKDPDGDGYSNLEEMYNGTNPHVFNTPYGPVNIVGDYTDGGNEISFSWEAADGPVLGYVIYQYNAAANDWAPLATNSASQLTYLLTSLSGYGGQIGVSAIYSNGPSFNNAGGVPDHPVFAQTALVRGPGGRMYMLTSAAATNVTGYSVEIFQYEAGWFPEFTNYGQQIETVLVTNSSFNSGSFYVPASRFTNGVAVLSDSQYPAYVWGVSAYITAQLPGNVLGNSLYPSGETSSTFLTLNVPFIDATTQMKQNVRFLLRAANSSGFTYTINPELGYYSSGAFSFAYPDNYVYSSYFDLNYEFTSLTYFDHFGPIEDNYFFNNFVFDESEISQGGMLLTGFSPFGRFNGINTLYWQYTNMAFEFPTFDYVSYSNGVPVPALLASSVTPWVGYFIENLADFGVSYASNGLSISGTQTNVYGLPYSSLELTLSNGSGIYFETLSPSNMVSGYSNLPVYLGTPQPDLQTVDYYFARPSTDPMPGFGTFAITNATPTLILGSVGTSMQIAGYAKQQLLNGNTNVSAYLGQYFSNALVVSNGVITTNSAGILSEYGEFFPTVPGQIALQTMPDPDQGGTNGTCLVNIIRLSLDVNHDGIMDESYTGPDNTGLNTPYIFWANNDYDRWTTDILDGSTPFEDDVATNSSAANSLYTGLPVPDYEYRDANGHRIIPCSRDLEDYARLSVSGISSKVLTNLPAGSTVTLSWAGIGTSPTIDIFQAADVDGGIGYQTNLTTASNQINTNICQYVGRLGPGGSIQLNSSTFSNGWAGDHFIWCGAWYGSDQLNLTISNTTDGTVLAQSSQYIQIQDIKQMYERWTVGDNDDNNPLPTVVPMSNAVPAQDNFSPGSPQQSFQYSYDPAYDTNDNYILYVHGWNEPIWRKDRWAETAFKRLYWQSYQGRFGEFRWPCFNLDADASLYDTSEWNAWNSGRSLERFLANLNSQYPGHVYLLAHSQGNVVVGEALRLATNQIVNTYVASQGAVSARAYDNTVPADATNYYTLTTSDPQGNYYTSGAPSYFSANAGAGKYVNFYNPSDYALMGDSLNPLTFHPGWLEDQSLKPDAAESYRYATPTTSIPSGYYIQVSPRGGRGGGPSPVYPLYFPTNTYQIFAMGAQSYSLALGAQAGVNGPFLLHEINLSGSPFNFGADHIQHDTQFVYDNMTTAVYWQQLLTSFALQPTP